MTEQQMPEGARGTPTDEELATFTAAELWELLERIRVVARAGWRWLAPGYRAQEQQNRLTNTAPRVPRQDARRLRLT